MGLYAPDGSINVTLADGTGMGVYAPDGSYRVTLVGSGSGAPIGTVTSVNGEEPDGSGNVTLTAADVGAASEQYVDDLVNARLSAAQRTAIDALDAGTATVADVVNALKAV